MGVRGVFRVNLGPETHLILANVLEQKRGELRLWDAGRATRIVVQPTERGNPYATRRFAHENGSGPLIRSGEAKEVERQKIECDLV